jgi:DNA-binding protein H-NS
LASIDLNTMTLAGLKQLQKDVQRAIGGFSKRIRQAASSALEAMAQEFGFSLSDLMGVRKKRKSLGIGGPKYRHPENPEITWTRRGRKPGWFAAALAAGTKPEAPAI